MNNYRLKTLAAVLAAACALLAVFAVLPLVPQVPRDSAPPQASFPADSNVAQVEGEVHAEEGGADQASDADPSGATAAAGAKYEAGTVLVTLAEGVTTDKLLAALSGTAASGFDVEKQGEGYVKLALPEGLDSEDAVDQLNATGLVESAQPNYYYHTMGDLSERSALMTLPPTVANTLFAQAAANDAYYSKQWALSSVNAEAAWKLVDANVSAASAVTVAVIDAGFRVDHQDIKDHVVDTYNVATKSSAIGYDNAGHGTHVAGIVSAVAGNKVGVAGATNNACGLMLLRASNSRHEISTDTIIDAYVYLIKNAKTHNVRVVNMSLGAFSDKPVNKSTDPALYNAIAQARNVGIVTVAAACNSEEGYIPRDIPSYAYPSDFDNVISVINLEQSTNDDGVARNAYSNYNRMGDTTKNISAPGTGICSTWGTSAKSYNTSDGTSMAAPLVSGIVGLMLTVNPGLTPEQVSSMLYHTAKDLASFPASEGWDRYTGYGEVDAEATVAAAGATATTTKASIAHATIAVSNATYTGKALRPAVTVKNGSAVLKKGIDYSVAYRDNTNVGKATVTVRGEGSYCGIAVGTFTISQATLSSAALKSAKAVYDGKSHKPAIKSVKAGGNAVSKANYTVKYLRNGSTTSNFKNVGKITVKVSGKNNCKGAVVKTFTINPKGVGSVKLTSAKKGFSAKWKARAAQTSGFELRVATNKTFTANARSFRTAKPSAKGFTASNLKAKKTYYVRVRAYKVVNGTTYYSSWSKTGSVKTK